MANKRMFNHEITSSDSYLDMPVSSRDLYFHLCMNADDDGFVNPKRIMRMIGASDNDLDILNAKRYTLQFESGIVVIKHWLIHNRIRKETYIETTYKEEKSMLALNDWKAYTEKDSPSRVSLVTLVKKPEWYTRRTSLKKVISTEPSQEYSEDILCNTEGVLCATSGSQKSLEQKRTEKENFKTNLESSDSSPSKDNIQDPLSPDPIPSDIPLLTEDPLGVSPPPDHSKDINRLMEFFSMNLNPTISYGNKTQRKACEELIVKFGYSKIKNTLDYYKQIKSDPFSPVITTPYQLQQKMGSLIQYHERSKIRQSAGSIQSL